MKRFIEAESRNQSTLFPESLDDYVREDNPVRVIDVFVDELDLGELSFSRIETMCNRTSCLSSISFIETVCLWIYEPHPFRSSA